MIVVAGEALVDLIIGVDGSVSAALGGAPFNAARTCGRLGADVTFYGAVSTDRFGSMLLAQLVDDGVDTGRLPRVSSPTTLAAAELDERGAARYHFYFDGTSAPMLREPVELDGIAALFTGGLGLVLEPMATTIESMVAHRPAGCLAVIDVNCRPNVIPDRDVYAHRVERVLAAADVVKVSDEDLDYLLPDREPAESASRLLEIGASVVLLTAGAERVEVFTRAGSTSVPVEPVDVVDTIGAGDAFGAGFVTAWTTNGWTAADLTSLSHLEAAVRAANLVAGVTCTRRGADPPRRSELPDDWAS